MIIVYLINVHIRRFTVVIGSNTPYPCMHPPRHACTSSSELLAHGWMLGKINLGTQSSLIVLLVSKHSWWMIDWPILHKLAPSTNLGQILLDEVNPALWGPSSFRFIPCGQHLRTCFCGLLSCILLRWPSHCNHLWRSCSSTGGLLFIPRCQHNFSSCPILSPQQSLASISSGMYENS